MQNIENKQKKKTINKLEKLNSNTEGDVINRKKTVDNFEFPFYKQIKHLKAVWKTLDQKHMTR